jgi:nitrogenase-associated protein
MATVTFFEKPGCAGNRQQKALLEAAGHEVRAYSLLAEPWTAERLGEFLSPLPVAEWFNQSAPAVRDGQIVPKRLDAVTAMALLLENPLLIRRPLMEVDGTRMVGFDSFAVDAWIGLDPVHVDRGNLEGCAKGSHAHAPCPDPEAAPEEA